MNPMSLELPDLLAAYFAAESRSDSEGLGACFADHAVVRDEGRRIEGVPNIKQWMKDAKAKYQHTVEPIEVVERDGRTVVTAKVAGNFPNSPVKLNHIFRIEDDRISSLEIR
jgi:ketosteroid isomerase-like protein